MGLEKTIGVNKMKKNKDSVTKFGIIVVILLIVVIGYYFYNKKNDNYNNLKIDSTKHLVYTKSKTAAGSYNQYTPFLNVKGELASQINQDIEYYISNFNKDNIFITYDSDLNGKVLSLVIKVEDYSYVESAVVLHFRTYNVKLDTMQLLSNESILDYFDLNDSLLEEKFNERLNEYYTELVNNESINEHECDYDCFIKSRGFQSGVEDNEYYIRDGKLVVYKPYIFMSSTTSSKKIKYDFTI